jgi:beta-glucanase (GH16 family)
MVRNVYKLRFQKISRPHVKLTPLIIMTLVVVVMAGASSLLIGTGSSLSLGPRLLFDDEFNGNAGSLPSSSNWNIETGDVGFSNDELECYTKSPKNVHLDGQGHLLITALFAPDTACGAGITQNYTSARLDTYQHFDTKYGTMEMSAKLPTAQGMWPAFWALGNNSITDGWPEGGEIDILEAIGSDQGTSTVNATIHGPYTTMNDSDATGWSLTKTTNASADLSQTYHTYAVTWSPGTISFQSDGRTYYTVHKSDLSTNEQWVFDSHPFYLLLNLAVGGDWPGSPDAKTVFPQTMSVDWVRVYSS